MSPFPELKPLPPLSPVESENAMMSSAISPLFAGAAVGAGVGGAAVGAGVEGAAGAPPEITLSAGAGEAVGLAVGAGV